MTQIQNLSFREATSNDMGAIIDIHNSNIRGDNSSNNHGFLLAKTTEEEVVEKLNHETQYFVAINFGGEILGFVALSRPKISNEFLNQIIWTDDSHKDKIISHRHIYIQIVAIKLGYMEKGIAQFMYKSLYEKFPSSFLSAFIVSQPIANDRSLIFHQKQGFHQIGIVRRDVFLDLKNYESILMFKEV